MIEPSPNSNSRPRTLIFSQRRIHNALFRCPIYEFEDIIREIDSADMLEPHAGAAFNARYQRAKKFAWHTPIQLNAGIDPIEIKSQYDLFFAACGSPVDLLIVNAVKNWKERSKISVCLLDELWLTQLRSYRYFLKILSKFDYVMLYYSQGVKALDEMTGCKCVFMPPGIDALLFSPYPQPPRRVVDVYSVGRRSQVTHQKLVDMATAQQAFYLHDTIAGNAAINAKEHRLLFANVAKRSRYFIVNPALIDRRDIRGDQNEIGNRYFEGAAAGTIMVGECPQNEEFDRLFDWPDAVMRLPYDSDGIDTIMRDLDSQPERQEQMRRTNVAQSLMRHDWAYRWEAILRTVGLMPLAGLAERKERLKTLAQTL